MKNKNQVIVLIGFKHTGKSVIGKMLAEKLRLAFVDVDKEIEESFQQISENKTEKLTCRKIMQVYGELFFRGLEKKIFSKVLKDAKNTIIATGGGTIIHHVNQSLIAAQQPLVIHITAHPDKVFKRIMANGRPAFFSKDNERVCFDDLWNKRKKIYKKFSHFTIVNNHTPDNAVASILELLADNRKKPDV